MAILQYLLCLQTFSHPTEWVMSYVTRASNIMSMVVTCPFTINDVPNIVVQWLALLETVLEPAQSAVQ